MDQHHTERIKSSGLTRRQVVALGVLNLAGWMLPPIRRADAALKADLELVARIPQMAERDVPLLVFRDFVADPDIEVEQHIRFQVHQRQDELDQLRQKIGFEKEVHLSVEDLQVRLMFVPQKQAGHAAAYHRYCLDVTDYLFEMNQMNNFYAAITSPRENDPLIPDTGISAFLVHRLAKAFRAVCQFTAESGRRVRYKVTGAVFSNHLGAVDLEIELMAPGRFGLRRKPYTIWQTATNNLFTLMALPVEETLHYYLGTATDRQIAEAMKLNPPESLAAARHVADEWMAVEESVVGGLVNRCLDRYYARHNVAIPAGVANRMQAGAPSLHQYRYRDQGVQLVQNLGFQKTMALYMDNPSVFREQLFRQQNA